MHFYPTSSMEWNWFWSRWHLNRPGVYQKALKDAGIPLTAFMVDDLSKEFERLRSIGVEFSMEPKTMGPVMMAVLDDTCGNNIQLAQML